MDPATVRDTTLDLHLKARMGIVFRRGIEFISGVGKSDQAATGRGRVIYEVEFNQGIREQLRRVDDNFRR
jgi:hypothetical protein